MAVAGIGGLVGALGIGAAGATERAAGTAGAAGAKPAGNQFTQMLDGLQGAVDKSDNLAVKAATGNLTDVHNYTIAATEAQMMTQLTVAVRDRAVEAFNEIMRMQP